ncbi:hypothetical protein CK203_117285 [Vitis vinifera]|uniref:Retrotransposon gag domain-containing protein n=1 Tax=Vitis vinifera TaxID=29760 RepID=A0A438FCJ8_VITVI|nr:hypothetical protein CK203_117285 [Vitis vinifera]
MHPPRMSAPPHRAASNPTSHCATPTYFPWMESENPYSHIKEFEEVCNTFQKGGASIDLMRLKLFPFTLKDKAKIWLNSLRLRTKENEKCYECWERYMEAINACPHHGFDTWLLVSYFYDVSRGWDEPNVREVGRMKSQTNAKGGMYVLNEDIDMKAKVAAMVRRLEELEMKKVQEVQAISETSMQTMLCSICQSYEHLVEECLTILTVREMFGDQANVIGQFKPNNNTSYGNTYNLNWRNHPNFSWKPKTPQYTQPTQAPQQASNLEQAITLARLTNLNTMQEKGKFLLNLIKIPRVSMKWRLKRENLQRTRRIVIKEDMMKKHMPPPFPQALHGKKGTNNASENFEVLRQVKVNIPLLDMIKQVPTYAKLLKDLCTVKRGLNVNMKAFLTEQVSDIIWCKSPVKYKDPGCPTILVSIGGLWRKLCWTWGPM